MPDAPMNDDQTDDQDQQSPDQDAATGTDADAQDGTDALGDPGKRALDSMKSKWHGERDRRRELEAELAALKAPKTDDDKAPDADAIRAEAVREANAKANARIVKAEIKALAAGQLADPADALAYLDLSTFEVDANGDVDADEIKDAIQDLLTRKPYLAATTRPRFQGTGDGGAARKASGPSQLTREALKGMSPEAIVKAKAEGRLKDLLGG